MIVWRQVYRFFFSVWFWDISWFVSHWMTPLLSSSDTDWNIHSQESLARIIWKSGRGLEDYLVFCLNNDYCSVQVGRTMCLRIAYCLAVFFFLCSGRMGFPLCVWRSISTGILCMWKESKGKEIERNRISWVKQTNWLEIRHFKKRRIAIFTIILSVFSQNSGKCNYN